MQAKQDHVRTKWASLIAGETTELQRINIRGQRRRVKAKSKDCSCLKAKRQLCNCDPEDTKEQDQGSSTVPGLVPSGEWLPSYPPNPSPNVRAKRKPEKGSNPDT